MEEIYLNQVEDDYEIETEGNDDLSSSSGIVHTEPVAQWGRSGKINDKFKYDPLKEFKKTAIRAEVYTQAGKNKPFIHQESKEAMKPDDAKKVVVKETIEIKPSEYPKLEVPHLDLSDSPKSSLDAIRDQLLSKPVIKKVPNIQVKYMGNFGEINVPYSQVTIDNNFLILMADASIDFDYKPAQSEDPIKVSYNNKELLVFVTGINFKLPNGTKVSVLLIENNED